MRLPIKKLTGKLGFLAAIAAAAVIGGASTGAVMASIPDSNGAIHTCYRKNASLTDAKGALRVIDTDASQTCTNSELPLNIPPPTTADVTALFRVKDGAVDTAANRNILDYEWNGNYRYCFEVAFEPNFGGARNTPDPNSLVIANDSSYASDAIENACGSGFNAMVTTNSELDPLSVWFTE